VGVAARTGYGDCVLVKTSEFSFPAIFLSTPFNFHRRLTASVLMKPKVWR
jgi:hypothetical protein